MPEQKQFIPLENNPVVLNPLAHSLGLSKDLAFHDLYSFDEELTACIPRPVHALLTIIPPTPNWLASRAAEDANVAAYDAHGDQEPVLWFKQTIGNACGLIGMLHCVLNGRPAREFLVPSAHLDALRKQAVLLGREKRAKLLEDSDLLEAAHGEAAERGDTAAPSRYSHPAYHFVAFVKGNDGHLYEMEGDRKGPVDRGLLQEDEDLLSPRAMELGLGRALKMEKEEGNDAVTFSCTVLSPAT